MNPLDIAAKATPAGWFRPWMIWAAAIAVLCVLLGIQTVRLSDAKAATAREVAAHEQTIANHAIALSLEVQKARRIETDLRAELDKQQFDAAKEKEIAKAREDALVESVRNGNRRLSVAAVCPGSSGQPGLRAPVAGGGGAVQTRAELDPATSERILSVGTDGDNAIRERNACVQAYEAVRMKISGETSPLR